MLWELAAVFGGALAFVVVMIWLERRLRQPGLFFFVAAIGLAVNAAVGFADGRRMLPILFSLQVPGFLYAAWYRRRTAKGDRS